MRSKRAHETRHTQAFVDLRKDLGFIPPEMHSHWALKAGRACYNMIL